MPNSYVCTGVVQRKGQRDRISLWPPSPLVPVLIKSDVEKEGRDPPYKR